MSISRTLLSVLLLGAVACTDTPDPIANDPQVATIDQEIGAAPACPPGDSLVYWTEPLSGCGLCRLSNTPSLRAQEYAACSGNIQGTKKFIQTVCVSPCLLD
jgi:hypothetical protein